MRVWPWPLRLQTWAATFPTRLEADRCEFLLGSYRGLETLSRIVWRVPSILFQGEHHLEPLRGNVPAPALVYRISCLRASQDFSWFGRRLHHPARPNGPCACP